ncbi:MAG: hypothetical protein KZQ74_01940, partial [gamma proteobacterium symbiont of Bathyaustriella thionipta]|nr:hypothetical protein [gamma proteobacterium symbiont of Bathyaustriella thionipta]
MNNRLRQQYLDAIGIQNWHLKSTTDVSGIEYDIIQESQNNNEPLDTNNAKNRFVEAPQNNQKRVSKSSHEPNVINSVPQNLLKKQPKVNGGSESLLSNKSTDLNESDGANHSSQAKITDNSNTDKKSLEIKAITNHEFENELKQSIKLCNKCQSRSTRLNALAGQGSNNASVFIVCGAPRAEEDRFGHY